MTFLPLVCLQLNLTSTLFTLRIDFCPDSWNSGDMENIAPPIPQTSQPIDQMNSEPVMAKNPGKSIFLPLAAVFLVVLVGLGAFYLSSQVSNQNPPEINPIETELPAQSGEAEAVFCTLDAKICPDGSSVGRSGPNCEFSPCPGETGAAADTSDWKIYTSQTAGFTIKYPKTVAQFQGEWQVLDQPAGGGDSWIGFRPSSMGQDYLWGIGVFTSKSAEEVIKTLGQQFGDRKETRQNLTINGLPATLVMVSTQEYPDWISKTVIIETAGKVFAISNGATEVPEFESFYQSFQLGM